MNNIELWNGDYLQLMKQISDHSVDMILTDLPYEKTQCSWDKALLFYELWKEYKRVIKKNGAICLFGTEPFSSRLRISNASMYKYDWIWRKPKGTGHLNANRQPMRDYENICVFYDKQCTYNPQFVKGEPYLSSKCGKKIKECTAGTTTYGTFYNGEEFRNDNSGFRYPKQVIDFGVVERNTLHQTQKPIELLKFLINTYTNEQGIILDSCMGSGSTDVACAELDREFIGIEIDSDFYEIAKLRKENVYTHKEKKG